MTCLSIKLGVCVLAIICLICDTDAYSKQNIECTKIVTAFPPESSTKCCGQDVSVGNKIHGGNETTIDEYPWLALIEYESKTHAMTLCGGALISSRYVLTAAHCLTGPLLKIGAPKHVRLGEHDTSNEGPDCVRVEGGVMDCNLGMTKIAIEESIPHKDYNKKNHNDIGLIRLMEPAPFTDFIRPICLPSTDITADPPSPFVLWAAGWGATSMTSFQSNVKLDVELPFVPKDKCQAEYRVPTRKAPLIDRQLCAGGERGKDSCKGDSGGPLMHRQTLFEAIGVISFGPDPCGMDGVPGVYTKVFDYKGWINEHIKA